MTKASPQNFLHGCGVARVVDRATPDFFDCSFCGARHDLARDRATLESGKFRWPTKNFGGPPAPDRLVLRRAFRYELRHAEEVVRQIGLRAMEKAA
jgi:hypothetical protein